jgi:hypothetical protein
MSEEEGSRHIDDIQHNARYVGEILSEVAECDTDNVIHAAKIRRLAEAHAKRAKAIRDQLRAEVRRAKVAQNSCKQFGVKNLSAAIGDQKAQAITCVIRDQDTSDGGKKGQMTTNPTDIDAVVRRAWKAIYDGTADATGGAVDMFMNKFAKYFLKLPPFEVIPLTGERVFESVSKTAKSAGALDGWSPEELALLYRKACHYVAILLNMV